MSGVAFRFLNEAEAETTLPQLFEILSQNMHSLDPTQESDPETARCWKEWILPTLRRGERRILLAYVANELAGYFQYSLPGNALMLEELEFKPQFQGCGLFKKLFGFLLPQLPSGLKTVEAYVNKSNARSQKVLARAGLAAVGENKSGASWLFQGQYADFCSYCLEKDTVRMDDASVVAD